MSKWAYGEEQLCIALDIILNSESTRKEALLDAYVSRLHRITEEEVPSNVWSDLTELTEDLSRYDDPVHGSAAASIAKLTDERVKEHLTRMAYWSFEFVTD